MRILRTYVYVDGLNLYYRALRGTPYKWLDLLALCKRILRPQNRILKIKYFTTRIRPTARDPLQNQRCLGRPVRLRGAGHQRQRPR